MPHNISKIYTTTEARTHLYRLVKQVTESHTPVHIKGKNNAVLIAEEDWAAIQETLFLQAIPGMREAIKEGMATPLTECSKTLKW